MTRPGRVPIPMRILRTSCIALAFACSEPRAPASFSVTDSLGIRVVESHRPAWEDGNPWTVSENPSLEIGRLGGDEHLQFFGIRGGLRLPDGEIVVLNSGTNTIRVFSPDGEFLNEFGGTGEGPGEFRSLGSVHRLGGDTLLVWDGRRPGTSVFTASGELLGSTHLRPPGMEQLSGIHPLPEGRILVTTYASPVTQGGDVGAGIYRYSAPLLLFNADGAIVDTLGVFPSTETMVMSLGSGIAVGVAPFQKSSFFDVFHERIYAGTADGLEVSVYDLKGNPKQLFRDPGVDLLVREEDRAWYRARMTEMARTPQEQQMLGLVLDALVFPETRAAFSDLRVDETGCIWLRTGRHFPPLAPSREWTVFSADGRLLGRVSLPESFEVLEFGIDNLLGVWKDEMDVEFVRLYALEGRGEGS